MIKIKKQRAENIDLPNEILMIITTYFDCDQWFLFRLCCKKFYGLSTNSFHCYNMITSKLFHQFIIYDFVMTCVNPDKAIYYLGNTLKKHRLYYKWYFKQLRLKYGLGSLGFKYYSLQRFDSLFIFRWMGDIYNFKIKKCTVTNIIKMFISRIDRSLDREIYSINDKYYTDDIDNTFDLIFEDNIEKKKYLDIFKLLVEITSFGKIQFKCEINRSILDYLNKK